MDENSTSKEIVDAAIAVHLILGPGLLETVYPNERFLGGLAREKRLEKTAATDIKSPYQMPPNI